MLRSIRPPMLLALLLLLPPIASSGSTYDYGAADGLRARHVLPHVVADTVQDDGLAYLAAGYEGLLILDLDAPQGPRTVARLATSGPAVGIFKVGSTVLLLVDEYELLAVDVSAPDAPVLRAQRALLPGWPAAALDAERLFIACGTGVEIFDISSPHAPHKVGHAATSAVHDLDLHDDVLSVLVDDGLEVFDVADPASPLLLAEAGFSALYGELDREGDLLAAAGYTQLRIFDVSDPGDPLLLADLEEHADEILLTDGRLYSTNIYGLRIHDLTGPTTPHLMAEYRTADRIHTLAHEDGLIRLGYYDIDSWDGITGTTIWDSYAFHHETAATPLAVLDLDSRCLACTLHDGLAFVATVDSPLEIHDVSDPAHPVPLGFLDAPGSGAEIAVAGGLAVVRSYDALLLVGIADPTAPALLAEIPHASGYVAAVELQQDRLWFAGKTDGLRVFDVSSPQAPVELGALPTLGRATALAMHGDLGYLLDDARGIIAIDGSDPTQPRELGIALPITAAPQLHYDGARLVVTTLPYSDQSGEILVFDASTSGTLQEVARHPLGYSKGRFAMIGDIAYVDGDYGLQVIDLAGTPRLIGSYHDIPVRSVATDGGILALRTADDGLRLLPRHDPAGVGLEDGFEPEPDAPLLLGPPSPVAILGAYPNPANPRTTVLYALERPGPVTVSLYDVSGDHLLQLDAGAKPAGTHSVVWDGRDALGRRRASGTYVVKVEHADGVALRKISLVR
ncbi:MAG TPA: FlgD immunoglobulin-like domain containing protein [Candidatus Krumholzibacteria bacterium]|nr:FlgD immunoglobulin-like domain containing protein [Candidatus Krumholzibacteria bacterium]HRX51278.1 FlgD immunoglobulin-like domain containing protein [Candidatus Krumholzibacteria bacterium]